ncbi:MAG TPA: hypothetical protein VMU02_09795 [bacterium]|nr:hypothetical protein [bacterium]
MKRRLILICVLVVIVVGAWGTYAYVQGTAPFERAAKSQAGDARAESALGACQHNCNPADCQKCPNMQGACCRPGEGQACSAKSTCRAEVCQGAAGKCSQDGKCPHAGNCVCPKGQGSASAAAGDCAGAKSGGICAGKSSCGSSCPLTK